MPTAVKTRTPAKARANAPTPPRPRRTKLAHAEQLVERMRNGFLDANAAAIEFLETKSWQPLRYPTCHAFWSARMSDIDTPVPVMMRAAYAMFDEGETPKNVAGSIKGLTPTMATSVKRQKENGLAADEASLTAPLPKNESKPPRPTKLVVFEVDREEYDTEWAPKIYALPTTTKSTSDTNAIGAFARQATREALQKIKI